MKASELLNLALQNYKPSSYMCHEIDAIVISLNVPRLDAADFLCEKINDLLAPHDTIVLHNYMRYTNKRYNSYDKRYGYASKACHSMRVAFWQDMIAELKAEGL